MSRISSIDPLWSTMPRQPITQEANQTEPALVSFLDIFRSAIQEANDAQKEVSQND